MRQTFTFIWYSVKLSITPLKQAKGTDQKQMKEQEERRRSGMAKKGVRSSDLYEAILMLETVEECKNFFEDLCTVSELRAMEQRYEVAKLLYDGMIYNDILERTGASSATISRVNRSLQYGADGYQIVFERRKKK